MDVHDKNSTIIATKKLSVKHIFYHTIHQISLKRIKGYNINTKENLHN